MTTSLYDRPYEIKNQLSGDCTTQNTFELAERKNATGGIMIDPGGKRALINDLTKSYRTANRLGWDDDCAPPVAFLTYSNGIRFIEQLPLDLPHPEITPDDDGYIEFEWYKEGRSFSFYITPSDVVLWAKYNNRDDRSSGRFNLRNEITGQDEIREELLFLIHEVYSEKFEPKSATSQIFFQKKGH